MQAEALVNTKELSKKEWLEYRKKGIGGSDASAVVGVNPWKTPVEVYLEKTNQINSKEDNEAMYWGRKLEDLVADEFEKETGKKAWRVNRILQHPDHSFMLGNLDRRIVGESALLECKTTSAYNKQQWEDGVPNMYQIQAQHYLSVTGYQKAYVAVLIGGRKFKYFEVERDQELINYLIKIEKQFWEEHVQKNVPPEMDGSRASSELLKQMYPEADPEKEIELDSEVEEMIEQRNEYRETEKKFKKLRKEQENRIKDMLGDAEIGKVNGQQVVKWKNISSTRFDKKKFREDHPELYEKYTYQSKYRRLYI